MLTDAVAIRRRAIARTTAGCLLLGQFLFGLFQIALFAGQFLRKGMPFAEFARAVCRMRGCAGRRYASLIQSDLRSGACGCPAPVPLGAANHLPRPDEQ